MSALEDHAPGYLDRPRRRLAVALFELRRVTWMGGTGPDKACEISPLEYEVALLFFFEQVDTWRDYWHEELTDKDTRETFWGRARFDAHATLRAWRKPVDREGGAG